MWVRKLTILSVVLLLVVGCASSASCAAKRRENIRVRVEGQKGGELAYETLVKAWHEAIKVFGGKTEWELPFTPDRVILVPSALHMFGSRYFGLTTFQPEVVNGKLVMVEVVEIHLRPNEQCHVYHVLVHEFGHCILNRRYLADATFRKEMEKYPSEEAMVRSFWPPPDDMNGQSVICND